MLLVDAIESKEISNKDVKGIIGFVTSREEFFKLSTNLVSSVINSKSEKVKEYFADTKAYIIGTQGGKDYYQVWFVIKNTPTFEKFELLDSKQDYLCKSERE